mmetsp:Transcript_41851/g.94553  ORF Transcript_41851/g.94553 Transcript_41851/m.94553 type:complete len:236 (-) Transcript_41851:432-1139(-)
MREKRNRLQRLPEAHFVGENAVDPVVEAAGQKAEPLELVVPHRALQRRGLCQQGRGQRHHGQGRRVDPLLHQRALPHLLLGRQHLGRAQLGARGGPPCNGEPSRHARQRQLGGVGLISLLLLHGRRRLSGRLSGLGLRGGEAGVPDGADFLDQNLGNFSVQKRPHFVKVRRRVLGGAHAVAHGRPREGLVVRLALDVELAFARRREGRPGHVQVGRQVAVVAVVRRRAKVPGGNE